MNNANILEQLRQCFTDIIPKTDARAVIPPLEFIISIIFCYLGDTECTSGDKHTKICERQNRQKTKP